MQSLLSIYIIKILKIFILLLLPLSDLTLATGREGIDNPFITLVARFLFVCRYEVTRAWSPTRLIPLLSKTEGNTYAALLHHTFLFKGKPTHCSRGSTHRYFQTVAGADDTSAGDAARLKWELDEDLVDVLCLFWLISSGAQLG